MLTTKEYDVLVVPEVVHNLTVWMIAVLHRLFGKRMILFGFGYRQLKAGLFGRVRERVRRFLLMRSDAIICYTERGRNACVEMGIDSKRVFVSQNTVDTEYLQSLGETVPTSDTDRVRREIGIGTEPVLIFVGRLVPEKRAEILIDTVRELDSRGVDLSLIVIGEGNERSRLERHAAGMERVHFVGAEYDEYRLAVYFMVSDLLVVPGRIGLTCVHAFSYGVPTVTSSDRAVDQSPEYDYLDDGKNSVIVSHPDVAAFADALVQILESEETIRSLRTGAKEAANRLTMANMVDQYLAAVKSTVA